MNDETISIDLLNDANEMRTALLISAGMAYGEAKTHQDEDPTRTALMNIAMFCSRCANARAIDSLAAKGLFK